MKRFLQSIVLGLIVCQTLIAAVPEAEAQSKIVLTDRPATVQAAADEAFEKNRDAGIRKWICNGKTVGGYRMLGLNDEMLLKTLFFKKKKNIYIIDVGGGNGGWARYAMDLLLHTKGWWDWMTDKLYGTEKQFHIFSVTGGQECKETIERKGNVTLYLFNQFKIENIAEEFYKRGYDYLKNNVDLMVSHATLEHLVDPFGTLQQMYSLLTPLQGLLIADQFYFAFDDLEKTQRFPVENWNIFVTSNAVPLFHSIFFLLMRNNDQKLALPLEYTGKISPTGSGIGTASGIVTVFKKKFIDQGEKFFLNQTTSPWDEPRYCDARNQHAKNLYAELISQGLFYR
jgi:hypothetical protein